MESNKKQINDWQDVEVDDWQDVVESPVVDGYVPPNKLESLGRGVEQGLTFGFGDEINAGLESLTSNKTYEDSIAESRENFRHASEENPWTSTAGNIVGGILPAGLLSKIIGGGAAAIGAASKTPAMVAKLANSVSQGAKGEGGIKALASAGAVEGAIGGAGMGAGSAESVEEIPSQMVEESKTGASFGAGGGALFGLGKKILSGIGKTDIGRDFAENWKEGNTGYNFYDQEQGQVARDATSDIMENVLSQFDDAWSKVDKQKLKALEDATTPFSVDKYKLESIKQKLPALDDLDAKTKLELLYKERQNLDQQSTTIRESLKQNPIYEILSDKPLVLDKLKQYQRTANQANASIRESKVLTKSASDKVNELNDLRLKLVENNKMPALSNNTIRLKNETLAKEIAGHPIAQSEESLEAYRQYRNIKDPEHKEQFIKVAGESVVDSMDNLKQLEDNKMFFNNLEKLSSDKGNNNKIIRAIDSEISNINKSLKTDTISSSSKSSAVALKNADDQLNKILKYSNIQLDPEDLKTLKTNSDFLEEITFLNKMKSEIIKNAKEVSIQEHRVKTPKMNSFEYELPSDQQKAKQLAKSINELETEFGDLNTLAPENAKQLWKRVRDIEKTITGGSAKNIAETAPVTSKLLTELKKSVREALSTSEKAVSVVDDTGVMLPSTRKGVTTDYNYTEEANDFAKANKVESQIANVIEAMTGNRSTYTTSPKEAIGTAKKLFQNLKDKSVIGESFDFNQALTKLDEITDPGVKQQLTEALTGAKRHVDLLQKYRIGQNRFLVNPLGDVHTTATASMVSSITKPVRDLVGKAVEKIPTPSYLYKPGLADKFKNNPTIYNMFKRLEDSSLSESKRRTYHNILMKNPIVNKELTSNDIED